MKSRIDKMATWGCDYTEFDNMDWCTDDEYRKDYGSSPGQEFPAVKICAQYNVDLCNYSKSKSMGCMAKSSGYTNDANDYAGGDIMDAITFESTVSDFNWWSKSHLQGFLDNDKPVVIVHYNAGSNDNKNSCDYIFKKYQNHYDTKKISYICESRDLKKYVHYDIDSQPTPTPPNPPSKPSPPTKSPTKFEDCEGQTKRVVITISTGPKGKQVRFVVKKRNNEGKFKKNVKGLNIKKLNPNAESEYFKCLDVNKCYQAKFVYKKKPNKGIKNFALKFDGTLVKRSYFKNVKVERVNFGTCA